MNPVGSPSAHAADVVWRRQREDSVNHLDLNPKSCTRSDLYDAYMDQVRRTGQMFDEVCDLSRRQSALEDFIRVLVEGTIDGQRCRLRECTPVRNHKAGRYVHVEPCRMAAGEELLRKTVKTRTHYGLNAPDVRSDDAERVFGPQETSTPQRRARGA
jgi:hypothetical protein